MTIAPAKAVSVPWISATTPPGRNGMVDPGVLVALDIAGVKEIYRIGGAHAIAALAYGTETISRVEKIIGPGGSWVSAAKLVVQKDTSIEFIAGPTEILILADETSDPRFIALDMLAQAEHDYTASAILVTVSPEVAVQVRDFIEKYAGEAERKDILFNSLRNYSYILIADDYDEAIDFINDYAPEHLEIIVRDDVLWDILPKIRNAGSIFIGKYTGVALGDYIIGSNHVLPTMGWARKRGGLSVYDYIKLIDIQYITPKGLCQVARYAIDLARYEGFLFHALSIDERLKRIKGGDLDG